jgi:hypothetical protein
MNKYQKADWERFGLTFMSAIVLFVFGGGECMAQGYGYSSNYETSVFGLSSIIGTIVSFCVLLAILFIAKSIFEVNKNSKVNKATLVMLSKIAEKKGVDKKEIDQLLLYAEIESSVVNIGSKEPPIIQPTDSLKNITYK